MLNEQAIKQDGIEIVKSITDSIQPHIDDVVNIATSEHPMQMLLKEIINGMSWILNYEVFTATNNKPILISTIILSFFLLFIGFKLAKKISLHVKRRIINSPDLDISVANSLERLSYYSASLLVTLFVLNIFNIPLTTFAVLGTTLAFGLGLGSQHIANNFLSGLVMLVDHPMKLEDKVEINGITGRVINIGTRHTNILTEDNCHILVPNSAFMQEVLVNRTNEHIKAILGFQMESNIAINEIDKKIFEAISTLPKILKSPSPKILYKKITQNFYDINVVFYINVSYDYNSEFAINDLNRALALTLQEYAIAVSPEELAEPEKSPPLTVAHSLVNEETTAERFI